MDATLPIAFLIAVATVAVFAWLEDWSGSRAERDFESYWKLHSLRCPECSTVYPPSVVPRRILCFSEPANVLADFSCPTCGEIATFFQTEEGPEFSGFETLLRECSNCTEQFRGDHSSHCPVCGIARSKVVRKNAATR